MAKILAEGSRQFLGEVYGSTMDDDRYSVGGVDVTQVLRELQDETLGGVADTDRTVRVILDVSVGPEEVYEGYVGVPTAAGKSMGSRYRTDPVGRIFEVEGEYLLVSEMGEESNISQVLKGYVAQLLAPYYEAGQTLELVVRLRVQTVAED